MQDSPSADQQLHSTGPALTLFVLGATVGLLSLLARLGQEFQNRLLSRLANMWSLSSRTTTSTEALPPLLRDLDRPGALFILLGCVASTLCLLVSMALWHSADQPPTRRTRAWTRIMRRISGSLWLAMLSAILIGPAELRNALIVGPGLIALGLLFAFVYLLVEVQFLNSAPPDDEASI